MSSFQTKLPDGVFAASVTPLKRDFTIDLDALVTHCNWLLANGNNGICLMGTTGEANSFSVDERIVALDHLVAKGIPAEKLLVGTGCCALTDSIKLTKHASSKKVGGVLMLPPFYYKGLTDEGLMKYFSIVVEEVASPDLKIYLYHFPKMTGVSFSVEFVKALSRKLPNTLVGMKDSGGDWNNMKAVMEALPGFKLYSGTEKYFLDVLRAGGAGVISATTNLTGNLAALVYQKRSEQTVDLAQAKLTETRLAFEGASFVSSVKHELAKWHKNENWLNIRPPNSNLSISQILELETKLNAIDFSIAP